MEPSLFQLERLNACVFVKVTPSENYVQSDSIPCKNHLNYLTGNLRNFTSDENRLNILLKKVIDCRSY